MSKKKPTEITLPTVPSGEPKITTLAPLGAKPKLKSYRLNDHYRYRILQVVVLQLCTTSRNESDDAGRQMYEAIAQYYHNPAMAKEVRRLADIIRRSRVLADFGVNERVAQLLTNDGTFSSQGVTYLLTKDDFKDLLGESATNHLGDIGAWNPYGFYDQEVRHGMVYDFRIDALLKDQKDHAAEGKPLKYPKAPPCDEIFIPQTTALMEADGIDLKKVHNNDTRHYAFEILPKEYKLALARSLYLRAVADSSEAGLRTELYQQLCHASSTKQLLDAWPELEPVVAQIFADEEHIHTPFSDIVKKYTGAPALTFQPR